MARSRKPVNPAAENALDNMKMEVANELGISERVRTQGWSTMTSADCGRVGGHMVRRMIEQYQAAMTGQTATATTTASTGATNSTAAPSGTMTSQFNINGN